MTKQEFEELDQDHKEMWIEMGKETIERWVKKQEIINLPYPENIIRFAYGSQSVLKEGYEAAFAEIEKTLSIRMIESLRIIFKEHSTLEEAADKLGIMNFSVLGAAMYVARGLRNWGRVRKIREFVEFHWDESETEES